MCVGGEDAASVGKNKGGRTHVFVGTVPFARLLSINQDTISYPNIGPLVRVFQFACLSRIQLSQNFIHII